MPHSPLNKEIDGTYRSGEGVGGPVMWPRIWAATTGREHESSARIFLMGSRRKIKENKKKIETSRRGRKMLNSCRDKSEGLYRSGEGGEGTAMWPQIWGTYYWQGAQDQCQDDEFGMKKKKCQQVGVATILRCNTPTNHVLRDFDLLF